MAAVALERSLAADTSSRPAVLAESWLKGTLAFLCLAPCMPGTSLKDSYAYVLVLLIVVPTILFKSRQGELTRSLFRVSTCGLLAGLVASWLSVLSTPLRVRPADAFQLAREFFPVLLAIAAPCLMVKIDFRRREQLVARFCVLFPVAVLLGFVLQRVSPMFFDVMLRYYYTQGDALGRGYMEKRPALTFGNPNVLGLAVALTGIVAATGSSSKLSLKIASTVLALVGTGSRTALAAYLIAMIGLFLMRTATLLRSSLVLGVVCLAAAMLLDLSQFADRIDALIDRFFQSRTSLVAREDIWTDLLVKSEWRWHPLFGLGPDKERLIVADSEYVLQLYRYGIAGLLCRLWWMSTLLLSGVSDRLQRRQTMLAERRVCLTISFAIASYAMAPISDPRLGSLFFLLLATSLGDDRSANQSRGTSARDLAFPTRRTLPVHPIPSVGRVHRGSKS